MASTLGSVGLLAGGAVGGLLGGILGPGSKPNIPNYPTIDIGSLQQQTTTGNLSALPGAEKLAGQVNLFNQDQLNKMWQNILPQYNEMISTASDSLASQLKGELPADVSAQIRRQSAAKSLGGGYGGSGMSRNLTARDLGLTSLDLTNRAIQSTQSFLTTLKSTSMPAPMSPATMLLTPEQRYTMQADQNNRQWQAQVMQAEANAMPDPTMAAIGGFLGQAGGIASGAGMMGLLYPNAFSGPTINIAGAGGSSLGGGGAAGVLGQQSAMGLYTDALGNPIG